MEDTMAIDSLLPRSRRALLAGALGGVGALVASALGRPLQVEAASNLQLDGPNAATGTTSITSGADFNTFVVTNNAAGSAIKGAGSGASGMLASSSGDYGIQATTTAADHSGAVGWSMVNGTGLLGYSNGGSGIPPATPAKTGVQGVAGQDSASVGVRGDSSSGRGGQFKGKLAQLRLTPSSATKPPTSGQAGDLFVDKHNRLWFCKGGATWKQIA
jgi:hypothetical protein